jgi:hypothetical protein
VQLPITLRALAPPFFIEAVPRQVLHGLSVLRRPPRQLQPSRELAFELVARFGSR